MNRKERIISLLTQEFNPQFIELIDDSAKHAGHAGASAGGETHYNLVVVSEKFSEMPKVRRHQAIYKVLDGEFKNGLHALAIKAMQPDETA
jgi:BolA protein